MTFGTAISISAQAVPNVTAHPSTASVPITEFKCAHKGLNTFDVQLIYVVSLHARDRVETHVLQRLSGSNFSIDCEGEERKFAPKPCWAVSLVGVMFMWFITGRRVS